MIRVHISNDTPPVDFPDCDGWFIPDNTKMLQVLRGDAVKAVFDQQVWAWVEDVAS